jgi:hypothetical protein
MSLSSAMSLLGSSKKIDFAKQFTALLMEVLSDIRTMTAPATPPPGGPPTPPHGGPPTPLVASDNNDYKPIRELLEKFYKIKLTDTNKLLQKLRDKLTILMTKHRSDAEYIGVIEQKTFYEEAIKEENLKYIAEQDNAFINIINTSIKNESYPTGYKNIFTYLYCSLLIIHYYPIVILDIIFSNAKTNITSFKTTIPKLIDNYTTNINTIISNVTSDADSATLAMNAANSASASAERAAKDLETTITRIDRAIARNEAIYTDPQKDVLMVKYMSAAKKARNEAENIILELEQKSRDAASAVVTIDTARTSNPDGIKQAIANAQILIKEATDSVQTTRKVIEELLKHIDNIEPAAKKIKPTYFTYGGSNTSDDTMVGGGPDDIKNILSIINDVLDETGETGSLIKYSTEIFYKALTILSISISLPNDFNSNNTIIEGIKNFVKKSFTTPLATPPAPGDPPIGAAAKAVIANVNQFLTSDAPEYNIFKEIIDNIFYNFYSTDEKEKVEAFKGAQKNNTDKQNKLKALRIKAHYAALALENAKEAQKMAQAKIDSAPIAAAAAATNALNAATAALAAANAALAAANVANTHVVALSAPPIDISGLTTAVSAIAVPPAALPAAPAATAAAAAAAAAASAVTAKDAAIAANNANNAVKGAVASTLIHNAGPAGAFGPPTADAAAADAAAADAAAAATAATAADNAAKDAAAAAAAAAADYAKAAADVAAAAPNINKAAADVATAKNDVATAKVAVATAAKAKDDAAEAIKPDAPAGKKTKKDLKLIPITNMKSDIDEQIATHFKEIFAPPVTTPAPKIGGQKTQKNRYRGGIHKNMNSIDSFDSIDSDL